LLETVVDAPTETGPIKTSAAGPADTGPLQPFDPYKTVVGQAQPTRPEIPLAATVSLPATPPAATGPIQPHPPLPQPPMTAAPAKKSSRTGLILGILGAVIVLGIVVVGAAYFVVIRPRLADRSATLNPKSPSRPRVAQPSPNATESPTPAPAPTETIFVPPANASKFVNSKNNLDGKLADHYVDFSFYYPNNWVKDPGAGVAGASNFAAVERALPGDLTQENFAVGWYTSTGSETSDREMYPTLAQKLSSKYENDKQHFPEYRKTFEGPTKAGIYEGYEFRFQAFLRNTANGDLKIWGRVVFLAPLEGEKNGLTLLMLATSLAPELKSADDIGIKGELPMILESFRMGKKLE
jgi:hypothetical protein